MVNKIARFKVKEDKLDECLEAIRKFVNSVHAKEPDTLRYDSYQLPDGVSFIHFMSFKDEDAEARHRETNHVKEFVSKLYPNCEQEPEFTDLESVI